MIIFSGGTGTPKLLDGLRHIVPEDELTVVVNTAEDVWVSGNLITPDIDTILYLLSGRIDRDKWWGVEDDTFQTHGAMKGLGHDEGMMIGDLDRATHIMRSDLLRQGMALSGSIQELLSVYGINVNVLPMSDDPVRTMVETPSGNIHFQDFWVKQHGEPEVLSVEQEGIEGASICPLVLEALEEDDEVLIGPSNPITSIGPIISLPGMSRILRKKKVVAVSPIIGNEAVSGPAGKLMNARGFEVSSRGIAECYGEFLDVLVLDDRDTASPEQFQNVGVDVVFTNTLMGSPDISKDLSEVIISIFANM
ncbi:2-phospho-L-lactate transferase [Methanococcoides sp.]|uniref:2-phospho-L-lactate transferase n=1 Tax=Methanococcoides sp. TaxID=1966350 RepID=UPI00272E80AD|nr:2-phospho-L-lactate transferase [Methanococcoides sp.]